MRQAESPASVGLLFECDRTGVRGTRVRLLGLGPKCSRKRLRCEAGSLSSEVHWLGDMAAKIDKGIFGCMTEGRTPRGRR